MNILNNIKKINTNLIKINVEKIIGLKIKMKITFCLDLNNN